MRRTEQPSGGVSTSPGGQTLLTYLRVVTDIASEPDDYEWTFANSERDGGGVVGGIVAFSGVDTANPINVEDGNTTPNGRTHTAEAIVTTEDNAMVVSAIGYLSASSFSTPQGMTEAVDRAAPDPEEAVGVTLQMAYALQPTAGNTGDKSATASSSSDNGAAHLLALNPADAEPPPAACNPISVGNSSTGTANDDTLTLAVPDGASEGDLLVAQVAVRRDDTCLLSRCDDNITPPAGWNLVRSDVSGEWGWFIIRYFEATMIQGVYYRVVDGTEPDAYSWSFPSDRAAGGMTAFSGVDENDPVSDDSGATGSGTSIEAPSVNIPVNGHLVGFFASAWGNTDISLPSSMTGIHGAKTRAGGNGSAIGASDELSESGGNSGSRTATGRNADNIGQLIALRPGPCEAGFDHLEIRHPTGEGLTCNPSTITIRAWEDAAETTPYTGGMTGTLSATGVPSVNWEGGPGITIADGQSSVTKQLQVTQAGSVELDAESDDAADDSTCDFGSPSCTFTAHESGFLVSVPDHVAETDQTLTIEAVSSDRDNPEQCVPAFENTSKDVTLQCAYSDPDNGTLPVRVGGTALNSVNDSGAACDGIGQTLSLSFDASGVAASDLQYADAGHVTLMASHTGTAGEQDEGLSMTGSGSFIARPDRFEFSNVECGGTANPAASSASGDRFCTAGALFGATMTAVNDIGDVTPNFGNESVPEQINVSHSLIAPAGEHSGVLQGASQVASDDFSNGVLALDGVSWSEVGIIDIQANLADGNYLSDGGAVAGSSGNIGRFTPARFEVSANSPAFAPFCGPFTYLGQTFEFDVGLAPELTITARNVDGDVTRNYGAAFWKLDRRLGGRSYSDQSGSVATLSTALDGDDATLAGDQDFDGQGTLTLDDGSAGDKFKYVRDDANREGPFDASVDLQIPAGDLTDTDGICFDPDTDGICDELTVADIGGTELRYGRLVMDNSHGPQTDSLDLPVRAEYFTAGGFLPNTDDSCTVLPNAGNVTLSDWRENLQSGASSVDSVNGLGADGTGAVTLTAPGTGNDGNDGSVQVELGGVAAWLLTDENGDGVFDETPSARGSFGMYRGDDRMLFWQEVQ